MAFLIAGLGFFIAFFADYKGYDYFSIPFMIIVIEQILLWIFIIMSKPKLTTGIRLIGNLFLFIIVSMIALLFIARVPAGGLENPKLTKPTNGELLAEKADVTLQWDMVDGATEYTVEISSKQYGKIDAVNCQHQRETKCYLGNLQPGNYSWRVIASNIFGISAISNSDFIIDGIPSIQIETPTSIAPSETSNDFVENFETGFDETVWKILSGKPAIVNNRLTALGNDTLVIQYQKPLNKDFIVTLSFATDDGCSQFRYKGLILNFSSLLRYTIIGNLPPSYSPVGIWYLREDDSSQFFELNSNSINNCYINLSVKHFSSTNSYEFSSSSDDVDEVTITANKLTDLKLEIELPPYIYLEKIRISSENK